jgi:hypothetical protein
MKNKIKTKNDKIRFFDLIETNNFSKIINMVLINFLIDKKYNFITFIDTNNNYNKNFLKLLSYNNDYFSYSNFSVNNNPIINEYNSYNELNEYIDEYKGFEGFMWNKNAIKELGLFMDYDEEHSKIDYLLRTFKHNENCNFIPEMLVSTAKYVFDINKEIINNNLNYLNKLSIIIVCLEINIQLLINCLAALDNNTYSHSCEVLLVFGQQEFNTMNILDTSEYKNIKIKKMFNTAISTYAEGLNYGVVNSSGKYLCFLKEYIVVDEKWDTLLIDSLETSGCLAVMPITNNKGYIDIDVSNSDDCFQKYSAIKNNISFEEKTDLELYCTIFKKNTFKKIGYFDAVYINGFEEIDYNEKIKLFEQDVLLTSNCKVYFNKTKVKQNTNSKEIFEMNANTFKEKWNVNNNYINKFSISYKLVNVYITDKVDSLSSYMGVNNTQDFINFQQKKHNYSILDSQYKNKCNFYNDINIDFDLYAYLHMKSNESNIDKREIYDEILEKGIVNGYIYSIDQIKNALNYENFFIYNNKYYIKHENIYVDMKLIIKNIYNNPYNYFINDIAVIGRGKDINLSQKDICVYDTIITCFIGNYKIGIFIINKLLNAGKTDCPILFIFKNDSDYEELKIIITLFRKRIVFKSREYGNDIIPTLQAVNYCLSKNITSKYIYKFHTKTDVTWFETATNYLLTTPEEDLIATLEEKIKNSECNCVSNNKYYIDIENEDQFCKELINKYKNNDIHNKTHFVAGSIFFTKMEVFEAILKFMENNNFRGYFMNNLYDSNIVFISNSPVHYLERLFGIIHLKQ